MLKSAQAWSGLFCTRDSTGALTAATGTPVGALYIDGTVNAASVTVTGANPYKWTVTLPALTAGQCVSMYITATISAVATGAVVAEDVADTKRVSDLNDIAAGAAMTLASGAITAAVIATGAVDADALAADAGTEIGTAVWASTTRTLTQTAAAVTAAVSGSTLNVTIGATFSATISGLTISATWSKLYLTVKTSEALADAAATVQVQKSVATTGDGLLYLNAAAPVAPITVADASLTVNQAGGTVAIVLSDNMTALLGRKTGLYYDIKELRGDGSSYPLTEGKLNIIETPTKSIT